jgi:Ohr subfamily peroxiredoxin
MTNAITPIEKVIYTAKAHTTGGRDGGGSRTSDGRLDVKLSVPGTPGTGTNPEQLFAVGWSACFLSAIKIVAARMKLKLPADLSIDTEVDLGTTGGGYLLQARLNVNLPGIEREVAHGGRCAPGVSIFQSHTRQHQRCDQRRNQTRHTCCVIVFIDKTVCQLEGSDVRRP